MDKKHDNNHQHTKKRNSSENQIPKKMEPEGLSVVTEHIDDSKRKKTTNQNKKEN